MENANNFSYRYSAKQHREVEDIRKKYLPREENKIERLRKLDKRVQLAGMIESLTAGIIGCLIFGIGMCFGLDVFGGADIFTLLFCAVGALVMLPAYPIYKRISKRTKDNLSPEILRLSNEIINNKI